VAGGFDKKNVRFSRKRSHRRVDQSFLKHRPRRKQYQVIIEHRQQPVKKRLDQWRQMGRHALLVEADCRPCFAQGIRRPVN
jgi:hypothetical protein